MHFISTINKGMIKNNYKLELLQLCHVSLLENCNIPKNESVDVKTSLQIISVKNDLKSTF